MKHTTESIIKTAKEIENIRKSGQYLTELLEILHDKVKPGITLIELEFVAEHYITEHHLKGAFKNYEGFPANLCLSVNDCVVHGIPDTYVIKSGDVVKIDCGIIYEGGITDSAITVIAGGELANPLGYELAKATKQSLDNAIQCIHPGKSMYDYSQTVYATMINAGFAVIKNLTGHGVGRKVHEKPYIYNFPNQEMKNTFFQPGMVVALEPITAVSSSEFVMKKGQDRNLYTKQGDFGAQWEYTVLVTNTGYEILSGMTKDSF